MRRIVFVIFLFLCPMLIFGQNSIYCFQSTDDGSLFYWKSEDSRTPGITVCPKDSLSEASRKTKPDFALRCNNVFFSGNNKYIFWTHNGKMYRAEYHPEGLTDTLVVNYPNLGQFACDANYDGTKLLACYDAPSLPKRCSPGFRMLLSFELRNGVFQLTDTLSPPDTCHFVSQANFLGNGYVLWRMGTAAHLMKPNGDGTYTEVALPFEKYIQRPAFLIAKSATSIFFYGYVKDKRTLQDDSLIELYEVKFVNGVYIDPLKIREWNNMPQWSLRVAISPDGTHLSWVDVVKDKNEMEPDISDVYTSHCENGIWTEPELIFSEVVNWGQRSLLSWMYSSNTSLYWYIGNARMILCEGFHKGSLVSEILLVPMNQSVGNIFERHDVMLQDTLIAKEQRLFQFQYVNITTDTLKVVLGQSSYFTPTLRTVPISAHAFTLLEADFPEVVAPNPPQNTWILAPGDTCAFERRVSFMATGEEFKVSLYIGGGKLGGTVEWHVRPKMVLRDVRRSMFEPFVGANGHIEEQCVRTKNGFALTTWYPNGKLHSESHYDAKGHRSGTWNYYDEAGVKIVENIYHGETRKSTTWYANGNVRSSGKYRKNCKLGIWEEYYEGGQKKSVAHFRRYWLLDITTKRFSADVVMCTSARKYTSWYANGKKQSFAHFSIGGRRNRTWTTWYETGALKGEYTYSRCGERKRTVIYAQDGNICYDSKVHPYPLYQQCGNALQTNDVWPKLEYSNYRRRTDRYYGAF